MRLLDFIEDIAVDLKVEGLRTGQLVEVDHPSTPVRWSLVDRPWIARVAKALGRRLLDQSKDGFFRVRVRVDGDDLVLEFGGDEGVEAPPTLEEIAWHEGLLPSEMEAATRECVLLVSPSADSWVRLTIAGALQDDGETDPANPSGLRILIAEDNPVNAKMLLRLAAKKGHEATWVENGVQCLEAYRQENFDLILMDVSMPEMDGIQATQEIRRTSGDRPRPWIVALTAHALSGDRERCLAIGMDDYLAKPIDVAKLFQVLDAMTR